ncbi:MAG: hypothetical protein QOE54_1813 [Streptosporangiaceae bacterium]|nr:hypothetical protein [Streptosporangiaceae bacterium]
MTDDLETLLRDHYRRAAEELQPGPGLIHRAQAAGSARRRRRLWTFAVAAATAGVVLAVPLLTVLTAGPGTPPRPAGPPAQTTQRALPIVLRLDRAVVPAGATIRLTGVAGVRLGVYLRITGYWQRVSEIIPIGGRYSGELIARRGTSAVRVCSVVSANCSATLNLVVQSPSAPSVRTPRSSPHPNGPAPVIPSSAHTPWPGTPTPVGSLPAVSPRPGH